MAVRVEVQVMRQAIELKPADVKAIVNATFPDYRRKKVWVYAAETVTLYDLNWSGGARAEYRTCTLNGQPAGSAAKYNAMAPWDNVAEGKTLPVPQGFVVVRGGHFCGKASILSITVNPADMPRLLPKPAPKGWDQIEA
jgi:hypothetical protein